MTIDSLELQLVRIDGRLDQNVEMLKTLHSTQQEALDMLREDLKEQSSKFASYDAVNLITENALTRANESTDTKVANLESKIMKTASNLGAFFVGVVILTFGLIEILPLIHIGD